MSKARTASAVASSNAPPPPPEEEGWFTGGIDEPALTVMVAAALCTLPAGLLTVTVYNPPSAAVLTVRA